MVHSQAALEKQTSPSGSDPVGSAATQGKHDKESPLVGRTLCFAGGSQWLLTKALSRLAYQDGEPPFEARQVFECTCVHDPEDRFGNLKDAVVKIKYQIKGSAQSLYFLEQYLEERQDALTKECSAVEQEWNLHMLGHAEELLYKATHPIEVAHRHTSNEIIALRRLRKKNSVHTPQFLDNGAYDLTLEQDDQAIVGGFWYGILMTKVPGKQLTYDMFWRDNDEAGRDIIRHSFKKALLELWSYRINPEDCAMRNIVWDENEKKCYIVDFEAWSRIDLSDPEEHWDGLPRWSSWLLSEEWGPHGIHSGGGRSK